MHVKRNVRNVIVLKRMYEKQEATNDLLTQKYFMLDKSFCFVNTIVADTFTIKRLLYPHTLQPLTADKHVYSHSSTYDILRTSTTR